MGRQVTESFWVIRDMLNSLRMGEYGDQQADDKPIPFDKVRTDIIEELIKWIEYHNDEAELSDDEMRDRRWADVPNWDKRFTSK